MVKRLNESNEIKVKLEGSKIYPGKIDARALGSFLIDFQSVIDKMMPKTSSKDKFTREQSKLFLVRIDKGSVELIFEPSSQTTLDEINIVSDAYHKFKELSGKINVFPEEARNQIKTTLVDPSDRLKLEFSLKNLMQSEFTISLYDRDDNPVKLDQSKLSKLQDWIAEDSKIGHKEIRGVILRIKGDEPGRYFTVQAEDGSIVKCYYETEAELKVWEFFKKPVTVVGIAEKKIKSSNLKEILDIQPFEHFQTKRVGALTLNAEVGCRITFDDDVWCLGIDELGAYACGNTYNMTIKQLESNIRDIYELYLKEIPADKMSESARVLKDNLQRILGEKL